MKLALSLSLFLAMQSCDSSRQSVEQDARSYFPRATAVQDGNTMLVYTCTDLGPAALNELAPLISEKLQKYKDAGFASITRGGWRTLAMGFENQIVLIDMTSKTRTHEVIPGVSYPGYSRNYAEKCNLPVKVSPTPEPTRPNQQSTAVQVGRGVTPPRVISRVEPPYTEEARREHCQGTATLEAIIRKDGTVEVVRVVRSAGCPGLDESATDAVKQWRFSPAMKDGMPVDMRLNIEVNFNLAR